MTCQRCQTPCPRKLCHRCAVTLSNKRRNAEKKTEYERYLVEAREWSKAVRGLAKDKVPIKKVEWLERPMP